MGNVKMNKIPRIRIDAIDGIRCETEESVIPYPWSDCRPLCQQLVHLLMPGIKFRVLKELSERCLIQLDNFALSFHVFSHGYPDGRTLWSRFAPIKQWATCWGTSVRTFTVQMSFELFLKEKKKPNVEVYAFSDHQLQRLQEINSAIPKHFENN